MGDVGTQGAGCISAWCLFYGLGASACVEKHKSVLGGGSKSCTTCVSKIP